MRTLAIELRKGKRTGVIPLMLAVGVLGAAYAFVNFIVRKDTLLNLPLAPMDVLLTQLYGMIMVLNMFGIIVAACMIYNMEFRGKRSQKDVYAAYECSRHVPLQVSDFDRSSVSCGLLSKPGTCKNRRNRFTARHI